MSDQSSLPKIRDKAFGARLEKAVLNHPHSPDPSGGPRGGNQKWLREQLIEKFNLTISIQAINRYFNGVMKPRGEPLSKIAQLLQVDEAWLSLGVTPNDRPREKKHHNAIVDGAVNVVAGMIQMSGGTIAFPSNEEQGIDFFAIIQGVQCAVEVKTIRLDEDKKARLSIPVHFERRVLILVASTENQTVANFIRVPSEAIARHGKDRGGFIQLEVDASDGQYRIGKSVLPTIVTFGNLEGEVLRRNSARKPETTIAQEARRAMELD